jgi:hypothetical protein
MMIRDDAYGKIHTDGSRSGGQPVVDSIEAKARDMVRKEDKNGLLNFDAAIAALCRAIEQHEAFKQEVSDAVENTQTTTEILCSCSHKHIVAFTRLDRFIIPKPKPDPLVEVIAGWTGGTVLLASDLRAQLDARGLEIREKESK